MGVRRKCVNWAIPSIGSARLPPPSAATKLAFRADDHLQARSIRDQQAHFRLVRPLFLKPLRGRTRLAASPPRRRAVEPKVCGQRQTYVLTFSGHSSTLCIRGGDVEVIKRLTAHGNSAALIIDKPILELLGIGMDTPLKIATDGRSLIISPADDPEREARFRQALERVNERHGETLRRLAE